MDLTQLIILNLYYSFIDVNADVSYYNSHRFFEVVHNSKPDINGSNENIISIFHFLTSSFFHLLIKQKPYDEYYFPRKIFSSLDLL